MIQRRQILALLALTLMWGINWPMMKLSLREITPLYFRALTMSCGALWLSWPVWQFSGAIWLSLVYGAFVNYGFAQIIWSGLARDLPPATSAMSVMAVPMVGTLAATVIVGEWPRWQDFAALVFVAAAIAAVLMPRPTILKTP